MTSIKLRNLLVAILAVAALYGLSTSNATAVLDCLTNDEARKIWPRAHLYWHTEARCWDASTQAEYRARMQNNAIRDDSAFGLAHATQASTFGAQLGEALLSDIGAISWWPTFGQSFETKWDEEM